MNFNVTNVSKALQKLEEKELKIRKLSGFTLDDIIELLAKGFTFIKLTADVVEVKHGEWMKRKHHENDKDFECYDFYHCSLCDTAVATPKNYCHHCGARMDEERK